MASEAHKRLCVNLFFHAEIWYTKCVMEKLLQFFPPPEFLTQPAAGLDISDRSVKLVKLAQSARGVTLEYFAEYDIPAGAIEQGMIKDPKVVTDILRKCFSDYGQTDVVASLPEELAYVVRLSMPTLSPAELRQAIELQLEQYVPLSPASAVFDYELVGRPRAGSEAREVAVSVFPKALAETYAQVIREAGFFPLAFEIESQALLRAALSPHEEATVMIVDIGKTRTGIGIVARGSVVLTSTITNIGGRDFSRNIERSLGVTNAEAETLKQTVGLSRASRHEAVFTALIPIMSSLKDELERLIIFWQKEQVESTYHERPVERIILMGGQASLPGFAEYLGGQLSLPAQVGDPWVRIPEVVTAVPALSHHDSLRFGTAIGSALRGISFISKQS